MADDLKIIRQIEVRIGKKLYPFTFNSLMLMDNGYALDDNYALQMKCLNLDETGITDISFLKDLCGLTHLSLRNNKITDLKPLSALTKLNDLWLNNNHITDLTPLSNLNMLKKLDLSSNQIMDLAPLRELPGTEDTTRGIDIQPWQLSCPFPNGQVTMLKYISGTSADRTSSTPPTNFS